MKWCPSQAMLAIATSTGQIELFQLNSNQTLTLIYSFQNADASVLYLSLDGSTKKESNTHQAPWNWIVSQSDGYLSYYQLQADTQLTCLHSFKAHAFEAWIASFDCWNSKICYSGGDDGLFKVWDVRSSVCSSTSKR
jgi:diphthamide biosynthesis protein 7